PSARARTQASESTCRRIRAQNHVYIRRSLQIPLVRGFSPRSRPPEVPHPLRYVALRRAGYRYPFRMPLGSVSNAGNDGERPHPSADHSRGTVDILRQQELQQSIASRMMEFLSPYDWD